MNVNRNDEETKKEGEGVVTTTKSRNVQNDM